MTASNQQLIDALMQFADKRAHWPGCRQSRQVGVFTKLARDGVTKVISPCSPKCIKAGKAVETAGGTFVQTIGRPKYESIVQRGAE
jgi:hypothetical protein